MEYSVAEIQKRLRLPMKNWVQSAALLHDFLCHGPSGALSDWPLEEQMNNLPLGRLIAERHESGHPKQAALIKTWIATSWMYPFALYFLRLYNEGFGCTADLVSTFLRDHETDDGPPYLYLLLLVLGVNRAGPRFVNVLLTRGSQQQWQTLVKDLASDRSLIGLIRDLPMPLRHYGGGTKTVIGAYDPYFQSIFGGFNEQAQFLGDLGGGYSTSDINRVTGLRFSSVDIHNPNPYEMDPEHFLLLRQRSSVQVLLTPSARLRFMNQQAKVPWIRWNVLDQTSFVDLLGDHDSYGFVSTAFLTSTVRPFENEFKVSDRTPGDTSKMACERIMELVATGKDVSLFTVGGPTTRSYSIKACLMRWQNRELKILRLLPRIAKGYWSLRTREMIVNFITPDKPMAWRK